MLVNVAISACLLGDFCRYDGSNNLNQELLERLKGYNLVPFCPEDYAFSTPRPTMDLIQEDEVILVRSNLDSSDLSKPILSYAKEFFKKYPNIELFIGKDRSPSCAVCSGKVYDKYKKLLSKEGTGLMAQTALDLGIESWDAEDYLAILSKKE
jgi:uncharacterized protein YbbK (DUF523 family)